MAADEVRPGQRVQVLRVGESPLVGTVHSVDSGLGVVAVDLDPPFPLPRVVAPRGRVRPIPPPAVTPTLGAVDPDEQEARRLAFARWLVASGRLAG